MKLLVNKNEIEKTFLILMKTYSSYYWVSAWAGSAFSAYELLIKNQNKIKKIIIGTHFYQTKPAFIRTFQKHKHVKFIKQTSSLFHPKMYLFQNGTKDWAMLIGSANFTSAAFNSNTEILALIDSNDGNSGSVYNKAMRMISLCWDNAAYFDSKELINYEKIFAKQKPKLDSLSDEYGAKNPKAATPTYRIPVLTMSWKEYVNMVRKESAVILKKRDLVISEAHKLFRKYSRFKDMPAVDQKSIAGLNHNNNIDWGWFGSMKGCGHFKKEINSNNPFLSEALDQIPLNGPIQRSQYFNFIKYYKKVFPGNYIATATRLLAMKRPDYFVCVDQRNKSKLAKLFGIVASAIDYDMYWDSIMARIQESDWWNSEQPNDETEQLIWKARGAFLDSITYEE